MKVVNRLVLVTMLVFVILAANCVIKFEAGPDIAEASGEQTANITIIDAYDMGWVNSGWDTWANNSIENTPTVVDNSPGVYWQQRLTPSNHWIMGWYAVSANFTPVQDAVDAGLDVGDIVLHLYVQSPVNEYAWQQTFGVYTGSPANSKSLVQTDANNWYPDGELYTPDAINFADISFPGWLDFRLQDVTTADRDYILNDADGVVTFYFMTASQATRSDPVDSGAAHTKGLTVSSYDTGTNRPYISYSYVQGTTDRTINRDTNAGVDATTDGTETADNITWVSPRAGYADEGIALKVNGDSGAPISLELQDGDGNVLDTVEDSIRTDGNYDYYTDLADSWYGWVRLVETNNNLYSTWGYQMPAPDDDQPGNTLSAVNTEYPQYDFAFSRFLTYENDAFVLHWKTNVQDDELADHNLQIWPNGDNTTPMLNRTLDWLNDNYYNSDNNDALIAWRYMILTPNIEGGGFDTKDGLIYNLGKNYGVSYSGFMQGVILDNTNNTELTTTHSCYWYLPTENDGLKFATDRQVYGRGDTMKVQLTVGDKSKIKDNLPDLTISILTEAGGTVASYDEYYDYGFNEWSYTVPASAGYYEVRFTFSGDDVTWSYIKDIQFGQGGAQPHTTISGEDGLLDKAANLLDRAGMDDTIGHWLVTIGAMILLFFLFSDDKILRLIMPLLVLCAALVTSFIDTWVVVLVALAAGGAIWGIIRRVLLGRSSDYGRG